MDGLHHLHTRKRIYEKLESYPHTEFRKRFLDWLIYGVSILAPVMNLPQLYEVWYYRDASGVSLISWASFAVFSVLWLFYGVVHRERPLIVMHAFLAIEQALIALGTAVYG